MSGPLYRFLAEDHARLDGLLQCSLTKAGSIDHAISAEFRSGLLKHISMEEKLLLLLLPTDCPQANPIERALGDVQDGCTRHHQRKRLSDLVADVEDPIHLNGPWPSTLSELYDAPAVTAAVEQITAREFENIGFLAAFGDS